MGKAYNFRESFALETQDFNSPNQNSFPSIVLLPSKKYESFTIYHFFTSKDK